MAEENAEAAAAVAAAAAKFDPASAIALLTPENADFATRKGYIADKDGKKTFDLNAGLESYRAAEKLIGRTDLLEPPDLSDDAKYDAWPGHKATGVPAKVEDYKWERPKLPDGIVWDEDGEKLLRSAALKGKLNQKQFDRVAKEYVAERLAAAQSSVNARAAAKAEFEAAAQKEWPGVGLKTVQAQAGFALGYVAKQIGMDDAQLADATAKMNGDFATTKLFAWIAKSLGEDTLKGGHEAGFASGPAAAKMELDRLSTDSEFQKAKSDATHPGHKAAMDRLERLQQIIHPD